VGDKVRFIDEHGNEKEATMAYVSPGYVAEIKARETPPAGEPPTIAKLRLDAANVLTWEVPKDGDPLLFMHLRRFAKAILNLTSGAPSAPSGIERAAEAPCLSFTQSEATDECKHCGWTECAHDGANAVRVLRREFSIEQAAQVIDARLEQLRGCSGYIYDSRGGVKSELQRVAKSIRALLALKEET
jgi:hypothetical protein